MAKTPSRVQAEDACAARVRGQRAPQYRLTSAKTTNGRRLKRGLDPWMIQWLIQALGILTYTLRCASELQCYPGTSFCVRSKPRLMVNFHLVGDHCALVIAQWFDIGDREISAVQFGH